KATMEVPSPFAGTVTALHAEPGQQVKVGQVMLTYAGRESDGATGRREDGKTEGIAVQAHPLQRVGLGETSRVTPSLRHPGTAPVALSVKAAPSVRFMARKLGIDLAQIPGSGPGGRILIGDLTGFVQRAVPAEKRALAEPKPDYGTPGGRIKLQGLRRK